jgi:hypothetical protein
MCAPPAVRRLKVGLAGGGLYSFGWWKETEEIEVPDSTGIGVTAGNH